MKSDFIAYKAGYKYQLYMTYVVRVDIFPPEDIETEYISLTTDGQLTIRKGYAWDGASGPAIDTKTIMRGSLVHDALCQLMRMGKLPPETQEAADHEIRKICLEDGMWKLRAKWVHLGVHIGGGPSTRPENARPILIAP